MPEGLAKKSVSVVTKIFVFKYLEDVMMSRMVGSLWRGVEKLRVSEGLSRVARVSLSLSLWALNCDCEAAPRLPSGNLSIIAIPRYATLCLFSVTFLMSGVP